MVLGLELRRSALLVRLALWERELSVVPGPRSSSVSRRHTRLLENTILSLQNQHPP